MDTGSLGLVALRIDNRAHAAELATLELASQAHRFSGLRQWTATDSAVDSSEPVDASVDGEALRISGVRMAPEPVEVQRLHQMEIATGPFERRLRVPIAFEREGVTAQLADGFLTVTLPKRGPGQRSIEIESGTDG